MAKSNNKQPFALNPETPLRLVAIHRQTLIEYEKIITAHEWQNFKKHKDYYYKTYQVH